MYLLTVMCNKNELTCSVLNIYEVLYSVSMLLDQLKGQSFARYK